MFEKSVNLVSVQTVVHLHAAIAGTMLPPSGKAYL